MELDQKDTPISKAIANKTKSFSRNETIEKITYMYPSTYSTENQIRWFKGSRDRGLKSDMAA